MIPGTVKIGSVVYLISLVDKLEDDDYGMCDSHTQMIYISKDQSAQHVTDTLLHEIMHAIWHESGLFSVKRADEEQIVRTTSTWITMVLKENPAIAALIINPQPAWPYSPQPRGDSQHVKR